MTEGVEIEELTREIKRYVLDQGLDLVGSKIRKRETFDRGIRPVRIIP